MAEVNSNSVQRQEFKAPFRNADFTASLANQDEMIAQQTGLIFNTMKEIDFSDVSGKDAEKFVWDETANIFGSDNEESDGAFADKLAASFNGVSSDDNNNNNNQGVSSSEDNGGIEIFSKEAGNSHQALFEEIQELDNNQYHQRMNEADGALEAFPGVKEAIAKIDAGVKQLGKGNQRLGQNLALFARERIVAMKKQVVGIGTERFAELVKLFSGTGEDLSLVKVNTEIRQIKEAYGGVDLEEEDDKPVGTNWKLLVVVVVGIVAAIGLGYLTYRVSSAHLAHNGGPTKPPVKPPVHPVKPPVKPPVHPVKPPVKPPVNPGDGPGLHDHGGTWHWGNGPKNG